MKTCIYLILVFYVVVIDTSCRKSFLDVPLTRDVVADDYLKDLATANELLNGIYFTVARDVYSAHAVAYADVMADNGKNLFEGLLPLQYNWSMVATNSNGYEDNMNRLWLNGYNAIRHCNFLLERIDQFRTENSVNADAIKGQALALRALIHFNLLNVFAQPYGFSGNASHLGIPYDTVYAQSQQMIRQTVNDVYSRIISDLQRSLGLMPVSLTDRSALNSAAAKAFLSKVYLFKNDFQKAKELSLQVIKEVPLMTTGYPSKLFTPDDTESIFWLQPALPSDGGPVEFQGQQFYYNSCAATTDLVDLINEHPGDLRKAWFLDNQGVYQITKFPQAVVPGIPIPEIAYYQTVVRSSESYLTAAETYAQLGQEDSARYYLDAIRQRADITAPASVATGPALLDSIYKERRKELCFENTRLYDLLRLKKSITREDVGLGAPAALSYPSTKAIAPIPNNDIEIYGLKQNEGY